MKVKQKKPEFKPITITLETEDEVRALLDFIGESSYESRVTVLENAGNQDPGKASEVIGEIYDETINCAGWQQP